MISIYAYHSWLEEENIGVSIHHQSNLEERECVEGKTPFPSR